MWFVSRLGGNPYCNKIDSPIKTVVCRFNNSSPLLPQVPGNIFISHSLGDILVVCWILGSHHWHYYAHLQRKASLDNCGFVWYDSKATLTPILLWTIIMLHVVIMFVMYTSSCGASFKFLRNWHLYYCVIL